MIIVFAIRNKRLNFVEYVMNITFIPLAESHFPLLIKWLEAPHVKLWWDQDIQWTPELIREKYGHYVDGRKLIDNSHRELAQKPIYAYIICLNDIPIGYIQYYNVHDFLREQGHDLSELPNSCAGLDLYIGEIEFLGKNVGSKALILFLDQHVFQKFDYAFVDPDVTNTAAIRAYEKARFMKIKGIKDEIWMIREK